MAPASELGQPHRPRLLLWLLDREDWGGAKARL
ncbi:hypothetical protein FRAAL6337 [Frankia alni ACN14a]|uniref:Uncharacterized protein n=1 Tax=Frankia alni (strain DSM 45986 / CECT 9034 / ACN14a) TaxID=326424 RepID=Q0RC67_FRAAA|nr:hypothetical protein FRAAL6337 [Frankia alni ACN14a]